MNDKKKTKDQLIKELIQLRQHIDTLESRNASKENQTEKTLLRTVRAYRTLSESNQILIRSESEVELRQEICRIIVEVGKYQLAWIGCAEQNDKKTVRPVAQAGYEEGYLDTINITWSDSERGHGPTGTAIRTGMPSISRHILIDPDYESWRESALQRGYESSIALPLFIEKQVVGALNVYAAEPDAFDDPEIKLLVELADNLMYGIRMLRIGLERDQTNKDLYESQEHLNEAQQIAQLGSWSRDIINNIIYWSDETYRIYGIKKDQEPSIQAIRDLIYPDDLNQFDSARSDAFLGQNLELIEYRIIRSDNGEVRSILIKTEGEYNQSGQLIKVVGTIQDITESKKSEESLRKLTQAVEQSSSSIVITTVTGEIEYVNPKFTAVTGYTAEEVFGKNPRILKSGKTSPEEYKQLWKTITSGKEWRGEFHNKKKNGEFYWELASISPVKDQRGQITHFIAIKEDITQRKRDEEALKNRADQLTLLNVVGNELASVLDINEVFSRSVDLIQAQFNYEHVGIYLIDPPTDKLYLRAKAGQFSSLFPSGHHLEPEVGLVGSAAKMGSTILTNDVRNEPRFYNPFTDMVIWSELCVPIKTADGVLAVLDVQSRKPNAFSQIDVMVLETLAGQLSIAMQNAHLFEVERRERALAQTYQRASESMSDFMDIEEALNLVIDLLSEIVNYERAMLLLVDKDQLLSSVIRGYQNEPDKPIIFQYPDISMLYLSMSTGTPLFFRANDILSSEWRDLPAFAETMTSWVGIPLITNEIVIGYMSLSTDRIGGYNSYEIESIQSFAQQAVLAISRSRLLEEIAENQTRLTRMARLSVAGEIASGVAHQINNPLTAVMAQSHLLMKSSDPGSSVYRRAEKIKAASYRAANVVQRMLDFSRAYPEYMESLDLNESVKSAISLVRSQIEPQYARIIASFSPDLPLISGSSEHLEDVWINLLLNARDALSSVDGAIIKISTKGSRGGKLVTVIVQDNGAGIPPEHWVSIFEPFFTTKDHGTGLGLSICHEIITKHGGTIRVQSAEDKGAKFIIDLPTSPPPLKDS